MKDSFSILAVILERNTVREFSLVVIFFEHTEAAKSSINERDFCV